MLNPELYDALVRLYGDVEVRAENQPADTQLVTKEYSRVDGTKYVTTRRQRVPNGRFGEAYALDCPFCGDTKRRLRVSYMFNTYDSTTHSHIRWGVHCFNETGCHTERMNIDELAELVDMATSFSAAGSQRDLYTKESAEVTVGLVGEIGAPGESVSLSQLSDDHPARRYVIDRGLDPRILEENYGVTVITRPYHWSPLAGRLLIPFYRGSSMIGWTARAVTADDVGRKYWNSTGSLGGYIYGLKSALRCRVAVAVEGPIDRWATGHSSFALLTAQLGPDRLHRLQQSFLAGSAELIVVLLDPKQSDRAKARGLPHPMDVVAKALTSVSVVPVLPVWLPEWLDPGASHGEFLAAYLKRYLEDKGYAGLGEILARDVRSTSATR